MILEKGAHSPNHFSMAATDKNTQNKEKDKKEDEGEGISADSQGTLSSSDITKLMEFAKLKHEENQKLLAEKDEMKAEMERTVKKTPNWQMNLKNNGKRWQMKDWLKFLLIMEKGN